MRKYVSACVPLLLIISMIVMGMTAFSTNAVVLSLSNFINADIQERLRSESQLLATLVTPAELAELNTPADTNKPLYREVKRRLLVRATEADVNFVYFYRRTPDGLVQPIVDNDLTADAYTLATEPLEMEDAVARAFNGETVTSDLGNYSPGFTGLLSAYSPIYASDGEIVAIAGVDLDDAQWVMTRSFVWKITWMLQICVVVVLLAGVIFILMHFRSARVLRLRLRQQQLVHDITRSFSSSVAIEELINDALQQLTKFLQATRVFITAQEQGESRPLYCWAKTPLFAVKTEAGIADCIRSKFPQTLPEEEIPSLVAIADLKSTNEYSVLRDLGVRSFVWAPVYVGRQYWGLLSVEQCEGKRKWEDHEVQLIGTVSSTISVALESYYSDQQRDVALQQATLANKAKTYFLANVGHEIRTPLNAIIGMAVIGVEAANEQKKDDCLRKIYNAAEQLSTMFSDILDMAKMDANKLSLSPVDFNFPEMMEKLLSGVRLQAEQKRQDLDVKIDDQIPSLLNADNLRLTQVLNNLLNNAIKFTTELGKISLTVKLTQSDQDNCSLYFEIADTGIGMEPETLRRLFKPFEQAESTAVRNYQGVGLSLAISQKIVEMMGGKIAVESQIGKGSKFSFVVRCALPWPSASLASGDTIRWSEMRVLVVDDDSFVLTYFEKFSAATGCRCEVADSVQDALALVAQNPPYDFLFIDYQLAEMNGIELLKLIRRHHRGQLCAIMITSADIQLLEPEAREAGFSELLMKPLFTSTIIDGIVRALERNRQVDKPSETSVDFSGRRVLLVEDIELNREVVIALLEPANLTIECVVDGKEAVEIFSSRAADFDIIFMDINMPVMDGYEATKRIRKLKKISQAKTVPIIAMTANTFREDIEKCLAAGMNDHIAKPLDYDIIISKLRKYLPEKS